MNINSAIAILGIWVSVAYAVSIGAPYELFCISGLATLAIVFFLS